LITQVKRNTSQEGRVPLRLRVSGKTDVGLVRSGNEDTLHLDEANDVYAVCDGMGGHQAGEVASMLASETIRSAFGDFSDELLSADELDIGRIVPPSTELLLKSIRLANRAIFTMAAGDPEKSGMGTTVVATAFESDFVTIAHVGDSRAYRLEEQELVPLTRDHSWIEEFQESQNLTREEASSFVGKNVITRALGVRDYVEVDFRIVKVKAGDTFILCSDGLCGFADDDEIFEVARRSRDDLDKLTSDLVQMANDRGGADNVTVVAIQVEEVVESPLPAMEVSTLKAESQELLKNEDDWVAKISQRLADKESEQVESGGSPRSPASGGSKPLLIGIFVVFIVVAFLIIYFAR
jgi:protein phosphatase